MKKIFLMIAFTGMLGSISAAAYSAKGDDKDKDKKAKKECCKKSESKACSGEKKENCEKGEKKSCCKKMAEKSENK